MTYFLSEVMQSFSITSKVLPSLNEDINNAKTNYSQQYQKACLRKTLAKKFNKATIVLIITARKIELNKNLCLKTAL